MAETKTKKGAAAAKPAKVKKPTPITYSAVTCSADGIIYCAQSAAGRSAKASVIVRHAAPGAPAEIVHEHGAKFQSVWVSPQGHCHAASNDGFHHTNESGAWTKTRVTKESFLSLGGFDDSFLLASSYPGRLFARRDRAAWAEVLIDGDKAASDWFSAFDGSAADDVYAVSADAVLHFDGAAWKRVAAPDGGPKSVVCLSRDEVYIASFTGLFRGNARDGFTRVAERELQHAGAHAGQLYTCAYTDGIFRWDGAALVPVRDADISVWSLCGGGALCAVGMQEGIHTYDGTTWSVTHS